jgi:hypothetical protein
MLQTEPGRFSMSSELSPFMEGGVARGGIPIGTHTRAVNNPLPCSTAVPSLPTPSTLAPTTNPSPNASQDSGW